MSSPTRQPKVNSKRFDIERDEAALLFLFIGDVERVHHGFHPRIGAPQCQAETDEEGDPKLIIALADHLFDLVLMIPKASAGAMEAIRLRWSAKLARSANSP